jgi:Competence protein CoiA-like family
MQYADDAAGNRIEATPAGRGRCPQCGAVTIAKCGEIVMRHWAHEMNRECDPWSEPETVWHRGWKEEFPADQREIVIGPHRADVIVGRTAIEFQHRSLASAHARDREEFYQAQVGGIVWVFDAHRYWQNINFTKKYRVHWIDGRPCDLEGWNFRWKWGHPSQALLTAPLFWDLSGISDAALSPGPRTGGELMFHVRKLHPRPRVAGWGTVGTRAEFVKHYLAAGPPQLLPDVVPER